MASQKRRKEEILSVAQECFGFKTLRVGQEPAVQSLLEGKDTLVVQPTGSGKSAIYQIAGLLLDGATVIVSPLIALQKDQRDSINARHAAQAALVNSTQRVAEVRETLERIAEGNVEYIFLAPEQLQKQTTFEKLKAARITLFVVDEAHCISEWGHDFRPDYLALKPLIKELDHPVVLAMTATASAEVRAEIVERLGLRAPKIFVRGFDRPNISLRVDHFSKDNAKREALVRRVSWAEKPGIVYVATRKNAEAVMKALGDEGVETFLYHGGLRANERSAIQEQFMKGEAGVIVATSAFGMGIDKSNIRFVYHYDIPDSLDSYYQEIGRAGRDGESAEAVLFYRAEDVATQKFLAGEGRLDTRKLEELAELIASRTGVFDAAETAAQLKMPKHLLTRMVHRLEETGAIEALPSGEMKFSGALDVHKAANVAVEEQAQHQEKRRRRLEQMQQYAETSVCRREVLLRYFGDEFTGPCNNCDNCERNASDTAPDAVDWTRREVF